MKLNTGSDWRSARVFREEIDELLDTLDAIGVKSPVKGSKEAICTSQPEEGCLLGVFDQTVEERRKTSV